MSLEGVLKENEVLLSQIKVRDNQVEDKQLQLRFHGLSDIYVPHLHTYASLPVSKDEKQRLIQVLNQPELDGVENPFYEYRDSIQEFDQYFNIVQIRAPRSVAKDFQKLRFNKRKDCFQYDKQESGRRIFRGGFYDKQARWNIGYNDDHLQPGIIYELDPGVIEVLEEKRELDFLNAKLKKLLRNKHKSVEKQSNFGTVMSRLRSAYETENNPDEKLDSSSMSEYYNSEIRDTAQELMSKEKEFRTRNSSTGELRFNKKQGKRKYELYLNKRPNLDFRRSLSTDEWMGLDYLMLDIETPKFKEKDSEITQVTCCHVSQKKVQDLRLYNKTKVKFDSIKGHEIDSGFTDDSEIVEAISDYAVLNGIDVIMAFNNNFDLRKLRERGDFVIGEGESNPKYEVTKSFFEKLGIEGGFCIDLLRIAQTFLRGFPNAKLEMFSRFLYGDDGYRKEINYQEMYELQLLSEGREVVLGDSTMSKFIQSAGKRPEELGAEELEQEAAKMILSYVADDGTTMYDIYFKSDLVQKCLDDCDWISNHFQLNFTNVLQSPNSLREVWDRGYFKHIGINRDRIYPKGVEWLVKQKQRGGRALKKNIDDMFGVETNQGSFENLERRLIPISLMLESYSFDATKKVSEFLEHGGEIKRNGVDPNRTIFFARYTQGLLDYVFEDLGKWLVRKEEYKNTLGQLEGHLLPDIRRDKYTLEEVANKVLGVIAEEGYFGKDGVKHTLNALRGLKEFPGFVKFIDEYGSHIVEDSRKEWLTHQDLYQVCWSYFNLKKQTGKVKGSYRIFPDKIMNILAGEIERDVDTLRLTKDIVHVDFPFMYTKDAVNPASQDEINSHLGSLKSQLPIQNTLSKAYISGKSVYSEEHGFYKGIKLNKDEPGFRSNPFFSDIMERSLNSFFEKEFEEGIQTVFGGLEEIRRKQETKSLQESDEEKKRFLFWTKSKEWFRTVKDGKPFFFTPEKFTQDKEVQEDEEGKFFETELNKKIVRINVMELSDFELDYKSYEEMYKKKMRQFVKGAEAELRSKANFDTLILTKKRLARGKQDHPDQLSLF